MDFAPIVIDLTEDIDIGTLRSWKKIEHKGWHEVRYSPEGFAKWREQEIAGLKEDDMTKPVYSERLGRHVYLLLSRNGEMSKYITGDVKESLLRQVRDKDMRIQSLMSQCSILQRDNDKLRSEMNQLIRDTQKAVTGEKKDERKRPPVEDDGG